MQVIFEISTNLNIYIFVYIANFFKQYNYRLTLDFLQY